MPDIQESSARDNDTSSWRKVSHNFFIIARARGYAGTLEPNPLDTMTSAMRKACFYSAFIVDNP